MFDYIKETYKKGDKLNLTCVNGEFSGEILFISTDSIVLKTFEGRTCGIKGCDISFFEEILPQSETSNEDEKVHDNKQDVPTSSLIETECETSIEKKHEDEVRPLSESTVKAKQDAEDVVQEHSSSSNAAEASDSLFEVAKPQIKVVGKIDLDAINQRTRPKKSNTPKTKTKAKQTFSSFDALGVLVEDEHKAQNEKYVPALGEIKFAKPESQFGFICDGKTGKDYYFSFSQIIDDGIDKLLSPLHRVPVVYSIQANNKGDKAITIHRPNKVSELINLAQELATNGEVKHALRVLEHILNEYPDNFTADELKNKLLRNNPQRKIKAKTSSSLYNKAKESNLAKDYPKAIEYFIKAIEAGEKIESSIKDLGMLYAQLYKIGGDEAEAYRDKVVELIDKHKNDLPKSISTLYYLENLYYSIQNYELFISIANELLAKTELQKDKTRSSYLLCKIAAAYIRINDLDNASNAIDEALSIDPNNLGATKLKDALENNNTEDIIEAISANEFGTLSSGLSPFIQQTLEDYDEYAGIQEKIIDSENFKKRNIRTIRHLIDTTIGRSKERAKYILTEVKLMQDIEPDESKVRSELAKFCNDMAKSCMFEQRPLDVIRFYYSQAFSLEDRLSMTLRQVILFLSSFYMSHRELLNSRANSVEKEDLDREFNIALKGAISQQIFWNELLNILIENTEITSFVSEKLFSNLNYRNYAIRFLNSIGIKKEMNSRISFAQAWDEARDKRKNDFNRLLVFIKSWGDYIGLDECVANYMTLAYNDSNDMCLCALDRKRLNIIKVNIIPALNAYIKSTGYRNKEANRNNANGQILQLVEDIKEGPTKISYEGILPFLNSLSSLLDSSFNEVLRMSEPRLEIKLLSEHTVINDDGTVKIQIAISNHRDSSPVKEISIAIEQKEELQLITDGNIIYNAIDGGESQIMKLKLHVGSNIIAQKATVLNVICNYKSGDEIKQASSQLSLKLYSQDEFKPIENPYAPIADGGPVPLESNMFFGREDDIEKFADAIIKSPSKQIIIYGQKRSGKSSVMYRLKHRLLETGKTFCVLFSIGDIINKLSEASFYYKIISSIKQELEFLELDGSENIPSFEIPSAKDFKLEDEDNPLNTFTKYMIKFKLACKQTSGWEDKNLVVMIDEFTYLYTEIKKGNISPSIMKQWKAITQNERAKFSVVLVGQDVVPSFKKEDYASNAFGVIQDMRLTYLKEEPARALIETPILDEEGHSRYIGEAVTRIIEYTSRNPYYIQIFCSRLVDYMNDNKSISVTEADVNEVARSFIFGSDALEEDKFDNLIRAGESEDLQEYAEADILAVLRQIALNSKNIGYCNREDIDALGSSEKEDAIIKDLCDREVIEPKGDNNYKIQVKLFQEWLLNH